MLNFHIDTSLVRVVHTFIIKSKSIVFSVFSILSTELNFKLSKMNELEDEVKTKYKTSLEQAYSDNTVVRKDCGIGFLFFISLKPLRTELQEVLE